MSKQHEVDPLISYLSGTNCFPIKQKYDMACSPHLKGMSGGGGGREGWPVRKRVDL